MNINSWWGVHCRELLYKCVLLHHMCQHTAAATLDSIWRLRFQSLQHFKIPFQQFQLSLFMSKSHSKSCNSIESFPQSPFHSLSNLSGWVISITPTVAVESFPQSQFHCSSNNQDGLSGQYQDGKFCFPRPFLVPNFDWESRPTKKIILDEMNLRPPVPQAWVLASELKFSQLTEQKFMFNNFTLKYNTNKK